MNDEQKDPTEAPPSVPSAVRTDAAYSPSSERETEALQDDQRGSAALQDDGIDTDAVTLLPGTGDYTDDGDVEVDPAEIHIPLHPDRDSAAPAADR